MKVNIPKCLLSENQNQKYVISILHETDAFIKSFVVF